MSQPSDKPKDDARDSGPAGSGASDERPAPPIWAEVVLEAGPGVPKGTVPFSLCENWDSHQRVYPLAPPVPEVAGVPRRFSVGVLMILVTLFAVLCAFLSAVLRSLHISPGAGQGVFLTLLVLFMGVAAGQVLLFQGRQARAASVWVGAILFPLELLILAIYEASVSGFGIRDFLFSWVSALVCAIPGGALLGYMAGTLTAGIFLVVKARTKLDEAEVTPRVELQAFGPSDIDTLLSWLTWPALLRRWAQGALDFPLNRAQVAHHLRTASLATPPVRVFKAVSPDTQQMVGYVELAGIDQSVTRSARIRRALVAPNLSRRGEWSEALVRAALGEAFDNLKVHRVEVTVAEFDRDGIACYKKLGFVYEGVMRDAIRCDDYYVDLRLMSILEPGWRWRGNH